MAAPQGDHSRAKERLARARAQMLLAVWRAKQAEKTGQHS
jgi:hypothetical protein